MKKTFLILLVLLCVATMAVASVSAASDDIVSDDSDAIALDDNAIEPISSTESDFSSDNLAIDDDSSISDDSGTNDNSVGAAPLKDGTTIYVSTTGSDNNDGLSEENAVATISHAVEIAGDGSTINIGAGEYTTGAIDLPASKSLSFIGAQKDAVTLKGTGSYVIGCIESGSSLVFKNLIFTGIDATGSSTGLKVGGDSPLEITDCTFTGINAKYGGLWTYTSNLVNIKDCTFKDLSCSVTGGAGAFYMTNGDVNIDHCIFDGVTYTPESGYMYGAFYQTNGNLTISNSIVTNVDGYAYAVLRTSKLNTFVRNTTFIKNVVRSNPNNYNNYGEAIIQAAGASAHLTVDACNFVENQARFGVVQVQRIYGNISYSSFIDNTPLGGEGTLLLINASSSYTPEIHADYNFYGINTNPADLVSGVTVDNWVQLIAVASADTVAVGDEITVTADYSQYTDGTQAGEIPGTMAEIPVKFIDSDSTIGTIGEVLYENNKAIVTFTGVAAGVDTVTVTAASISTEISITVTGGSYSGPIYVSKDGSDTNDGKEDSPVATIAKAIELAQAGSGQIIVNEGTYTVKALNITEDLEISSVGEVIFDGDGVKALWIKSGDVSISNITFTNCLDQYSGSALRISGGDVTIDGCTFKDNGGSNARDSIINIKTASVTITNTKFENNTAHLTSTSYSVVYASDSSLIVDNCNFTDNKMKYGSIYMSGTIAVINNTIFTGMSTVSSSGGSGGGIYLGGTSAYQYSNGTVRPGAPSIVLVENCDFINNTVNGGNLYAGTGAAIYVNNNASLIVKDSRFINNTCANNTGNNITGKGGAIYASAGSVQVSNSVFENNVAAEGSEIYMRAYGPDVTTLNKLDISNCIILDDGTSVIVSNYTNGSLVANNNWWGDNDNPSDKVTEGITVDKWVIMNVDPTLATLTEIRAVEITVDFVHVTDAEGTISELDGTLPEEFTVKAMTMEGSLNATTLTTVDGIAKLTFTPAEAGESVAYIVYGQLIVPVTVNVTGPYEGPIYVATDGSDDNIGSPNAPVASIAKAIELAQAGVGQVIITDGTYSENNITINSEIPLSIVGEGNVVIDGTGLSSLSIFIINTTAPVTIENITFTNNKAKYGAAIKATGGRNALLDIDVTINNCTFDKLEGTSSSRGGAIYTEYTKGSLEINNSVFTNCNATGWGGALGICYSAYEDGLDLVINNTSFDSNYANNGGAGYLMANTITIENSNFTNNGAIYSPGALYLYNCTATMDNCILVDNYAKNTAAAMEVESVTNQPIAVLTITNSVIENNTGRDALAPAINVDKATLYVSYSSLVNDLSLNTVTATGYDAIYGQGIAIANNNWWGTNDPTTVVNGTNITIDKWVIMNVEANATDVVAGDEVKVTVDFNHVNTTAGEIEELTGGVIPKEAYTVVFTVENGTVAPQTVEVPQGESADVIFTASQPFATVTATSEQAVATLIFEGEIPVPYTGIVYVSKDGDDANNGSEDAPVATIAKAIEIATGEEGSGQIIINEGTYTGTWYQVTKDLNITGVGEVVIDGEGLGRLFNVSADVENFAISNVVLSGANHGFGAAVYTFAKETVLDNVTIINNAGAGDLITTYGNLTIKDSEISGHDGGDVIQASGNADIVLNNTQFLNNVVTAASSDYGIVYISGGRGNLIVEDCLFSNNTARQGVLIGASGTNISVKSSDFVDNKNTVAYGGVIRALSKLDVTESVFINNEAGREGGAIYIGTSGDATITKSEFINNTCGHYDSDYNGDAISSHGKLTINYCILLPAEGSSKVLIFNNNEDETPNAQYNWWGTNDDPKDLVAGDSYYDDWDDEYIECPAPDVSNWIFMNVEADIDNVEAGAQVPVTVDFKHYIDANYEIQELADSLGQELIVKFLSETGSFDYTQAITVDQVVTGTYTAAEGVNNITVTSSNASVNIGFEVNTPIETAVTIVAPNIWIGNQEDIAISVLDKDGNPATGTVTVKFGEDETTLDLVEGAASYTIPIAKLVAGENSIEVAYNPVGQYMPSEANATFMVLDGVVTKDTFKYYFDANNNYYLFDYVPEGVTLDFQGDFIGAYTTNIDKPVNIVSTTGDAYIETNKTGSFNILAGGSGTNVTGLKFLNTAFYITNAHDVVIDNINMVANMSGVGSSTGFLSIRSNSSYVTVKNSYFENGGTGSSCVVIGMSSYCVIDNNVINATKNSGNLIYITTYVGTGDTPCYNNITNNRIESVVNSGFCYAIAVIGAYNNIENNTINHPGTGITQQSTWGAAPQPSGFNTYINNTLTGGCGLTAMANSTVLDNNVAGAMTINGDSTAQGNVANTLTVNGANCIVKNNIINGTVTVAKAAKNTEMTGNIVNGLVTVNSDANTITGNGITSTGEYAIDLKTGANNTVTDNILYGVEKCGDAAVKFEEGKDNTVQYNIPLTSELTLVIDDAVTGEPSNIQVNLVDAKGTGVSGTVTVTVNGTEYNVTLTDGKGTLAVPAFEETGTFDVVASFSDLTHAQVTAEATLTVYGPGNVTVKHTDAGDAADIQAAIDAANPGDVVQLGNYDYTDVADVNITKNITLAGTDGTSITSTGDGTPIFNVPAISENGPENVTITGVDFKLANGDTVVKATADNDTNPLSIVTPSISITDNTFETVNDTTVPESINILELDSERGVLSPTGEIAISDNTIAAGINPFEFEITSIESGGDVVIEPQNITPEKKATVIDYQDMTTTAVDIDTDGRVGEYFKVVLKDADGNVLSGKDVQIGFNGKIYNRTTDENGSCMLQINLVRSDIYTFAVSFIGDEQYNGSFVVAKITVNKQEGSLTVPSKSYSASAKTKSLTATFKSASGKVVAGKSITFTVNGKTYTATTNAKGVATVNVSLNKKGTYSFTAKFAGDSTYAAIKKTAKLTIK